MHIARVHRVRSLGDAEVENGGRIRAACPPRHRGLAASCQGFGVPHLDIGGRTIVTGDALDALNTLNTLDALLALRSLRADHLAEINRRHNSNLLSDVQAQVPSSLM